LIELKVKEEFSDEFKKLVNYFASFVTIEIDFGFVASIFTLSAATQVDQFVKTLQTKSDRDKRWLLLLLLSTTMMSRSRLDRLHCYNFQLIININIIGLLWLCHHFEIDFEDLLQAVQNFNVQKASFLHGLTFCTLSVEVCIMSLSLFHT